MRSEWVKKGAAGNRISLEFSGIQVAKCNDIVGCKLPFQRRDVRKTLWKSHRAEPLPSVTSEMDSASVIDAEMYVSLCSWIQKQYL